MPATALTRYRILFAKTEAMRFTGHLDLHRTWERTFRRAGLPLAYSEGFNPHPKLNIGAALPLGCLSRGDLIDAWLERQMDPAEVERALRDAAPPGIEIESVKHADAGEPVLQSRIRTARFEVSSAGFPDAATMNRSVEELMAADQLLRERRGKSYDLRQRIERLEYEADPSRLTMWLSAREGAVGRPEEVLDALGLDVPDCVAMRVELVLAEAAPSTDEDTSPKVSS
jgi:radical SAM-linked protein